MPGEKVKLEKEKETLLIPLYSKAMESKKARPIIVDAKARDIIEKIEYDFTQLKIPMKTQITLCIRARELDNYVREFVKKHPDGTVVHLGCGLDSRVDRVGSQTITWYDLDFPEVIQLRKKFYQETDRYRLIPSSVTDFSWMEQMGDRGGRFFFVAEGLFMYLGEHDVKNLLLKLQARFPGCQLVFDVFSSLTARNINKHPSIRKTGAEIHWGLDDARELENWHDGIVLVREKYFTESEEVEKLPLGYRLGFKLAGLFSVARKAHRILFVQL